ncbi:MAG TPA: Fic family protein [Anaeromyxobacteraceae bacterium]|jgi:Fic family protein|nr:Fic family protein [Anaeromyxobacteraceae bacterium]
MRSRYIDIDDRSQDLAEILGDEPEVGAEFLKVYELSWLHHENALEGAVYTAQELSQALHNHPVNDSISIAAHREVRNHKAAIDLIRAEAKQKRLKINMAVVKRLYETLGQGFEHRQAAELRKEMPLHRAYFHEIAQPAKIQPLLAKLFEQADSAEFRSTHPVQQASRIHHGFMQIYPFTENSGKVARLLANLLLLHAGLLPCIIHSIDRQRYYDSLKQPETALRELMLEAIENGLVNAEKLVREARAERRKLAR